MEGGHDKNHNEGDFVKRTRVGSEVIVSQIKKQHTDVDDHPSNQKREIACFLSPKQCQRTENNEPTHNAKDKKSSQSWGKFFSGKTQFCPPFGEYGVDGNMTMHVNQMLKGQCNISNGIPNQKKWSKCYQYVKGDFSISIGLIFAQ